jgi:hypothetical protein
VSLTKLFAVATYCADWHNGQWSREYRILCTAMRRLEANEQTLDNAPSWIRLTRYYRQLVDKYQTNKVR